MKQLLHDHAARVICEHLEAGHHGQADIREHKIRRLLQDGGEPGPAIVRHANLVTPVKKFVRDQRGRFAIILDAEDSLVDDHVVVAVYPPGTIEASTYHVMKE